MSKPGEGKRRPGSLLSDRGSPAHEVLAQPAGIGVGGVAAGLAALLLAAYLILFTNYAFWKQLLQAMPQTVSSLEIAKPTLNDVFLQLTGRAIRDEGAGGNEKLRAALRRRGGKGA